MRDSSSPNLVENRTRLAKRQSRGLTRLTTSLVWAQERLSSQSRGHVVESGTHGVTLKLRRDALSQFEIDGDKSAVGGGAESLGDAGDKVAGSVPRAHRVSIENGTGWLCHEEFV